MMASGSVIYIPSFMHSGGGVQQLLGVINGHTQQVDLTSLSNFYEYGNRPKREGNDTQI
jgi:hypothetical protein